jgi:hypothetical protein
VYPNRRSNEMKNILALLVLLFASFVVLASGRRSSNPAAPSNTADFEKGTR